MTTCAAIVSVLQVGWVLARTPNRKAKASMAKYWDGVGGGAIGFQVDGSQGSGKSVITFLSHYTSNSGR